MTRVYTFLALLAVGVALFAFSFLVGPQNAPLPQSREGMDERNLTYTISGEPVMLVDGYSETPAAPGSASRTITRYFGNSVTADIDGNGIPDVAFLITQEGGGSGVFFYLVAALQQPDGTYRGSAATLIGDRIAPQTTEYRDGLVIVNYADRIPGEPMSTRPSEGKSLYLKYSADTMDFGEVIQNFEGEVGDSDITMATYEFPKQPVSFQYRESPVGYHVDGVTRREGDHPLFTARAILTLQSDYEAMKNLEGTEGPPTINIDVFANPEKLAAKEWAEKHTLPSNFNLTVGEASDIVVGGVNGVRYMVDGLYRIDTVVLEQDGTVVIAHGAFLEEQSRIRKDFESVLNSIMFAVR